MIIPLTWLESLAVAACVTATDPVLASSVVGKGKFAKRVPKHLRDMLSAESGCNDGMAFPFIYLSVNLIHYHLEARETVFHWVCFTILYECVFGAVYGFLIGYLGRHAIKLADKKGLIDRESFLVFYFVLALFCAGSGSLLGTDDLLVGFAAGVGFSNDGWFSEKTEESHVSNVIDLLLNLAYFVFLGAIIPWEQYNNVELGMVPWRLVVISIMVIFFRRIPALIALKPIIPDVKNWREALFAGHFGPIGVGAIFAALLTRAELETHSTQPLPINELPKPGEENFLVVQLIWPITTFLVITSILVHGSSIAVFTLGKRINTLSLTMSYTQGGDQSWMNRLPRIASVSRNSMSRSKADFESTDVSDEKLPQVPPGTLGPLGFPGNFLRRQREDENNHSRSNSRSSSLKPSRRKKWDSGIGPGGPISQSAIKPQRISSGISQRDESPDRIQPVDSERSDSQEERKEGKQRTSPQEPEMEIYEEGDDLILEDEEGNVIADKDVQNMTKEERSAYIQKKRSELGKDTSGEYAKDKHHPHAKNEGEEVQEAVAEGLEHPMHGYKQFARKLSTWDGWKQQRKDQEPKPAPERKRGPAHAYQYGNTIIVEDEDGEVVKKYDLPDRRKSRADGATDAPMRLGIRRMTTWAGLGHTDAPTESSGAGASEPSKGKPSRQAEEELDDEHIRFTLGGSSRRMTKQDFIAQLQSLDPKAQIDVIDDIDAPKHVKDKAKKEVRGQIKSPTVKSPKSNQPSKAPVAPDDASEASERAVPSNSLAETLSRYSHGQPETAAQRRRREASRRDSDDDGTERVPPSRRRARDDSDEEDDYDLLSPKTVPPKGRDPTDEGETAAERKRRLAALGEAESEESDSDEDGRERQPKKGHEPVAEPVQRTPGIRFAETPAISQGRVQWGEDVKSKPSKKK